MVLCLLGMHVQVRFYPPMHIGAQPPIRAEAIAASGRRRLSELGLQVEDVESGSSSLDGLELEDAPSLDPSAAGNETALQEIKLVPFIHICGNGIRSSQERCDDNNTEVRRTILAQAQCARVCVRRTSACLPCRASSLCRSDRITTDRITTDRIMPERVFWACAAT